jgi:hypothetical protein
VHDLRPFLREAGVEIVPVDRDQAAAALHAWTRFGQGRHPAGLNYGDGFAYALAATRDAPLLFVGDDFARTHVDWREPPSDGRERTRRTGQPSAQYFSGTNVCSLIGGRM